MNLVAAGILACRRAERPARRNRRRAFSRRGRLPLRPCMRKNERRRSMNLKAGRVSPGAPRRFFGARTLVHFALRWPRRLEFGRALGRMGVEAG